MKKDYLDQIKTDIRNNKKIKLLLEKEKEAIRALDEALKIAEELGVSRHFSISSIHQRYLTEDGSLKQEVIERVMQEEAKLGNEIDDDGAKEIMRDSLYDWFSSHEYGGGWEHSDIC